MNRVAFGLVMMLRMRLIWQMSVPIRKGKGNGRGPIFLSLQVTSAGLVDWNIMALRIRIRVTRLRQGAYRYAVCLEKVGLDKESCTLCI